MATQICGISPFWIIWLEKKKVCGSPQFLDREKICCFHPFSPISSAAPGPNFRAAATDLLADDFVGRAAADVDRAQQLHLPGGSRRVEAERHGVVRPVAAQVAREPGVRGDDGGQSAPKPSQWWWAFTETHLSILEPFLPLGKSPKISKNTSTSWRFRMIYHPKWRFD